MDFGWRLSYDRALTTSSGVTTTAALFRADSKTRTFTLTNGVWTPDPGQLLTALTQQVDGSGNTLGWTYVNENDEVERYDTNGKLLSIANRAGLTQTLQYNVQNTLASVTDAFGRQMTLTYNNLGLLSGVTDPNGGNYSYTYTTDGNNNLSTVTYPDGHARQYVYENTQFVHALTGIVDENGNRFATWSYDANGNAIMSEHAGGVEEVTLTYPSTTTSIATDVGGATRTYSTLAVNGIAKAGSVAETCGSNCVRTRTMTYDADGNIASRTDYNGNVTNYAYDLTRDLEISRTEAAGTAQARTITTQWHATYRLPLVVTEPGRTTTYTYDNSGNRLTKTIAAGGNSRTWSYTYNGAGQAVRVTGPRSDVSDVTFYGYDGNGNLNSITNAVGQVTTLSNYDANGRVGLITDPNGATTTLSYAPRGWLTSKIVTAGSVVQSTSLGYDNVGQLLQVMLPDGSSINYTYDSAHRLTNITDSVGNSIAYTLDLMDNRVSETVSDQNGALTRQISRIFDVINRLHQVTGAAQ
jgi:YD repeat-containing protein